jgi:formylglycine-generating enzyme required for sulfatase activity
MAFVFNTWHRAAVAAGMVVFCQLAQAQTVIGKGFIPDENGRRIEDPVITAPITDDRALWDTVKDSRDISELQAYLAQFPKGLFATVAAIRIRALAGAGTATSPQAPPQASTTTPRQNLAAGQIIKDCTDCPEMVVIPAGSFEMGSSENADERPVHRVNVPSFLIGKTEVTQGQWKTLMGGNPSRFSACGDDCPVETVSWEQAQEFARRLSAKTGKQYRIPSEAVWEYAARAGNSSKWSFGDNDSQLSANAWYSGNSRTWTQRVAQKRPNAFGLFDMHGNVWEWVQDCWHDNYAAAPTDGSAWTTGCSGSLRVLRGGSWDYGPTDLRSARRGGFTPEGRSGGSGLRLARTP